VQWAATVPEEFNARFSAISRRYQYIIYNHPIRSSLYSSFTTLVYHELAADKMHAAAQALIGEHDFTSFRSAECQSRTPMRHVFAIKVVRQKQMVIIDIIANSFLHHMVRNIAGVLIEVGAGRKPINWCQELLLLKNRNMAGRTALSSGLYLSGVRYADTFNLPSYFKNPIFLVES
jgi:tRNA pseudouridine38-40 synthase